MRFKSPKLEFNAKTVSGFLGALLILGSIFSILSIWWLIPGLLFFIFFLTMIIQ